MGGIQIEYYPSEKDRYIHSSKKPFLYILLKLVEEITSFQIIGLMKGKLETFSSIF